MISPQTVEYLLLSHASSSQSRMYLIILLSLSLWRPFGSCYLFAVETPRGSTQLIRDCCSVNSPLTSSGWAGLPFKRALSSKLLVTDSRGGGFNGITVCAAPRTVVIPELTEPSGGCSCLQKQRKRGRRRQWCWRKEALFSLGSTFRKCGR